MLKHQHGGAAMGFDFGLRRIGVAIGRADSGRAQPLSTVHARQGTPDWSEVAALIEAWQPKCLVVGNPNSVDNQKLMAKLKWFTKQLNRRFALPVDVIDEQYSSLEAGHQLKQIAQRRGAIKKKLDKVAAVLILESWFYEQRNTK